jgi:LmbE family N-acetylglucosaminyl deacetylase
MALAADAGHRVVCANATRGELGTPDPRAWPPARLAVQRTRELACCLAILGVEQHRWLGFPDGGCAEADSEAAVDRLCALIDEVQPQTVLTFGPDGITGHADHRAVSAWVTTAFGRSAPAGARLLHAAVEDGWARRWRSINEGLGVFLGTDPVTVPAHRLAVALELEGDVLTRKVRALRAQATQTDELISALGPDTYTAWVAAETFVEAS